MHAPTPLPRRVTAEGPPSHQDILDAIEALERQRQLDADARADLSRRVDTSALTMQRIEGKLDDLKPIVGWSNTDRHGEPIGEGIAGDLMRLKLRVDKRFGLYDGWAKWAAGALAAATLIGVIAWRVIVAWIDAPKH